MIDDLHYQNAHCFLAGRLIPLWTNLAAMERFSQEERVMILSIPNAIALLPELDENINLSADIDYYWDDKNWIGRLNYKAGELELWSHIFQEEGPSRELNAQWQHTATKISSTKGLQSHDAGHLWYWIECFALFVAACRSNEKAGIGHMLLLCNGKKLQIEAGDQSLPEED